MYFAFKHGCLERCNDAHGQCFNWPKEDTHAANKAEIRRPVRNSPPPYT